MHEIQVENLNQSTAQLTDILQLPTEATYFGKISEKK
jgi:hypothetical protein